MCSLVWVFPQKNRFFSLNLLRVTLFVRLRSHTGIILQVVISFLKYYSGLEEAVIRNIKACKEFSQSVRSAYGPNGMNKMVINHIEKQFVTSDAATIIRELDVEHPAAKLMILASEMQDAEVGDGTNFVIILAGALLGNYHSNVIYLKWTKM